MSRSLSLRYIVNIGFCAAVASSLVVLQCYSNDVHSDLSIPAPKTRVSTSFRSKCEAVVARTFGPATVVEAEYLPENGVVPEHCDVRAVRSGHPEFEMSALLPASWNGELFHAGGGGLDGVVPSPPFWNSVQPLERGMTVIASNGGHKINPLGQGIPLSNDTEAMIDYAYRAIATTNAFGRSLLEDFYRALPTRSYFMGCSKGGTDALQAAAHYPQLYDGIIAQAPAPNISAFISRGATYATRPSLGNEKWSRIFDAYVAQCDALDGLVDGVVSNRAACKFDASRVPGLSAADLLTVRQITSDMRLSDGELVNRRYWWGPQTGIVAVMSQLSEQWLRYIILDNPHYDPKAFELNRYWHRIHDTIARYTLDVDPEKVARYLQGHGKLLIFMGVDDPTLSVDDTVSYYRRVKLLAGDSSENTQMYLMPGVAHCGSMPSLDSLKGAGSADMLGAMQVWVELGREPQHLSAAYVDPAGKTRNTRPLCIVGSYPRYTGLGDPDSAANFICEPDGS
jgi:pimeloyl-ACP methyl ester carboxylesterase